MNKKYRCYCENQYQVLNECTETNLKDAIAFVETLSSHKATLELKNFEDLIQIGKTEVFVKAGKSRIRIIVSIIDEGSDYYDEKN